MASTMIPADMKFINMALQVTRPDGKPSVPIWVTAEENLVCVALYIQLRMSIQPLI